MNEKIKFNQKEEEGEYKVPEFYRADWRDDVPEEKEDEDKSMMKFEILGGDEKKEREYVSPTEISKEAKELLRAKRMKRGLLAYLAK